MEFPNFCLPYMANDGQLPSARRAQGHMTHLSWDEGEPCVLENGTILAGADRDMPPPGGVDGEYLK
jgi:hypothetical protein